MHDALVSLPRKIAFLLHQRPAYISSAIEAFYLRDPIAMKPLQAKGNTSLVFSPTDLVTLSARFPRVGYAQLKSQDYQVPVTWANFLPSKDDTRSYSQAEIGMRLSCGFEMLLTDPQNQDKPTVREMKMLLEDLDTGDETLPLDRDIEQWPRREDDEKWLDISFEDLEGELDGTDQSKGRRKGEFGDKATQEKLQRIVAQFEQFLKDDRAGPDGAGLFDEASDDTDDGDSEEESDGEDKEASFDEDEFSRMMREMMGMPGDVGMNSSRSLQNCKGKVPTNGSSRLQDLDSSEQEEKDVVTENDIKSSMQQMEAELKASGALNLDPDPISQKTKPSDRRLRGSPSTKSKAREDDHDSSHQESDSDEPELNTNANLAKNLLESLKSQAGTSGPGGNLIGLMGLKMPRDERDDDGPHPRSSKP
jgi:hypothetical protein